MMSALLLSDVALETAANITGEVSFNRVSTDTRKIQAGDLFVALSGENFNGDEFVTQAANAGAAAVVVSKLGGAQIPQLEVDDTRLALGQIAKMNRRQFVGPLVALTGSAGKTTAKTMIASILSELGEVLATTGNFNNEVGVPLTLLELNPSHQYAVVEMGAGRKGDIAYLTQFAEPTIALLTNALAVHVEGFGNVEAVATTKGAIFECLPETGVAVINFDDRFCEQWQQQAKKAHINTFSKANPQADFYAKAITVLASGMTHFELHTPQGEVVISLPLLGEHNVVNAIAAAATAMAAGASLAAVKTGLEKVQPVKGRLQTIISKDLTIIDDSYNANPDSVKAAIDVLANFTGERCLVLGEMGELAALAESGHQQVADYAREKGIEKLIAVGQYAKQQAKTFGDGASAYSEMALLLAELDGMTADVLLVKGSRSAKMERVVEALLAKKMTDNGGKQ